MKVHDSSLNQAAASQLGKAQQGEAAQGAGAKKPGDAQGGAGGGADQVQLSDLSARLVKVMETASAERAGRIERLAAEFRAGRYQADAREVSRRIVDDALQNQP